MQPSAARAASVRRDGIKRVWAGAVAGLSMVAASMAPAVAGDRSLIDYVGFSEDFRYFAFEEFGIQDGSGFAYSNIYVVDLTSDSWVIGTPIRVQADSDTRSLADVRKEAMERAGDHVSEFKIDVPVETAAMIGDGVPGIDAQSLTFGTPGYVPGSVSGNYTLSLTQFEAKAVSPCDEWFGIQAKGYQLDIADGGAGRLVYRDGGLPRSRGCPTDYRLYSVVMPYTQTTLAKAVAIVSYYPAGFEGPDRRFLAVPLGL